MRGLHLPLELRRRLSGQEELLRRGFQPADPERCHINRSIMREFLLSTIDAHSGVSTGDPDIA